MGITVRNTVNLRQHVERMNASVERTMKQAVELAAGSIQGRTQGGRDEDGNTFKPYSPAYEKFKASKGRKTSPPDLTFTGDMLNSMQTKVEGSGGAVTGIIYLTGEQAAKARGNEDRGRKFFGFGEKLTREIKALFKKEVKA